MENITLQEYYDMLEKHDWYHMMSDDGRVDRAGMANFRKLETIARQSSEHYALFEAWEKYMWTGEPWKTERAPKPERPL